MTRRNRMKKLAGFVRDYKMHWRILGAGIYEISIKFGKLPNNYRKHIQQLKALRGRR